MESHFAIVAMNFLRPLLGGILVLMSFIIWAKYEWRKDATSTTTLTCTFDTAMHDRCIIPKL